VANPTNSAASFRLRQRCKSLAVDLVAPRQDHFLPVWPFGIVVFPRGVPYTLPNLGVGLIWVVCEKPVIVAEDFAAFVWAEGDELQAHIGVPTSQFTLPELVLRTRDCD